MNTHLRTIPLDLSGWTLYKTVEPFRVLGVPIEGLRQECYQTELNGEVLSAGVFEYTDKKTHIAWGIKSDPHCSFHALALSDGGWGAAVEGCPEYQLLHSENQISGFSVDGQLFVTRVRKDPSFLQKIKNRLVQFAPLIFFFVVTIIWATVKTYFFTDWSTTQVAAHHTDPAVYSHIIHEWMLDLMGGFFILFGALKAVRLKKFAVAFSNYDIIAGRLKIWGYVYPFIELCLGILYTLRSFLPVVYIVTAIVMFVGCIGIFLKLKRKDDVVCACLGGFFDIPLTPITLFENLLMVSMALAMFLLA